MSIPNFNEDKLEKFKGRVITVRTKTRSYTGRLVMADDNEVILRVTSRGRRFLVSIPVHRVEAVILPSRRRTRRRRNRNEKHC